MVNQMPEVLKYAKLAHGRGYFGNDNETILKTLENNGVIEQNRRYHTQIIDNKQWL